MGKIIKQQIHPLAISAIKALNDDAFESEPGMCQRYVRQVIKATYGPRFEQYRGKTAHLSALLWKRSTWDVPGQRWGIVGDIFYWHETPGQPEGHAAIRIPGNKVAENSVYHASSGNGKGTRKLSQLSGYPDVIVRLPWQLELR